MKKLLTALLLTTFLSGAVVASDLRGATRLNETTISVAGNTTHPALLQRYGRRRIRFRRIIRNRSRNNGSWNRRRWNNRRWDNRGNNRRGRRRGRGHVMMH